MLEKPLEIFDDLVGNNRQTPRIARLPGVISYFLGYRDANVRPIVAKVPEWARLAGVLVVTYIGLLITAVIHKYGYPFKGWNTPSIIPSFGASAVLCFNATGSPLAQPRNLVMGSMIASFTGIVLMKFWMEHQSNEQYLWLGAPLACSITSVLLSIFGCIHPPVGATAMLPLLDDQVRALGWKYMVVELTDCSVFLAVACLFDNIFARYPMHWWNPHPPKTKASIEITATDVKTNVQTDEYFDDLVRQLREYL